MLTTRALNEERGGVLALSAILIPVFIVLVALLVDVGTWYTHKRQLQNRADAAALAAGVEYGRGLAGMRQPRDEGGRRSGDRVGGAPVRRRPAGRRNAAQHRGDRATRA